MAKVATKIEATSSPNYGDMLRALNPEQLEQEEAKLEAELAAAWKKAKAGPLTEAFFHAFTIDGLRTLAAETWGLTDLAATGKAELVEELIERAGPELPACFNLSESKRRGRKKKGR